MKLPSSFPSSISSTLSISRTLAPSFSSSVASSFSTSFKSNRTLHSQSPSFPFTFKSTSLYQSSSKLPYFVSSIQSRNMSISNKSAPEPTLFIDGKWCHSSDGATREVIDPFTAKPFTYVDEATSSDALAAIKTCRAFFDNSDWSSQTCATRSKLLLKIADFLQRDRAIIAEMEVKDTGKTLEEAKTDIDDVTAVFRFYAEEGLKADKPRVIKGEGVPENVNSKVVLEPVGVCVLIAPWNYPLLQICWKLAPALVTGNVCIVKPSEVTPLSTIHLVKIMLEAGVPAGALQLLTGAGSRIGDALTQSPDVDLVSFTGGLQTGRRIIKACAGTVKRCTVELGGKNPNIVFADCKPELDRVADTVLTAVFLHSGQVCSSGTRLIVEESIADELVAEVVKRAQRIVLGSGLDPATETGPNVSKDHLEKLEAFLKLGLEEGAVLRCGGGRPDPERFPHLKDGYFFLPTVLDRCDRSMRIVTEETFGPILTVERFKDGDEKHAIFLANDTPYGLAGGVQSGDIEKAKRVAKKVRHGTVWINTYGSYTPRAEWGGFGMSGNGRELGEKGLDEYTEAKHIYEETTPAKAGWFKGEGKEHGSPAAGSLKAKL